MDARPKGSENDRNMQGLSIILGGTGVNYSWHLPYLVNVHRPHLADLRDVLCISGGVVAYSAVFAKERDLLTWDRQDFLRWDKHAKKAYGNGVLRGTSFALKRVLRSKAAHFSLEDVKRAFAVAVKSHFFDLRMRDMPANLRVLLLNKTENRFELASSESDFADEYLFDVVVAATAIPGVFPKVKMRGCEYMDAMFERSFFTWIREHEAKCEQFIHYNMYRERSLPNGRYVKICNSADGKKQIASDTIKFLFGLRVPSYAENIKKCDWVD